MKQTTDISKQVHVPRTMDVETVERELSLLWGETAGAVAEERAVMRARVLNLMVCLSSGDSLETVNQVLQDVTISHPCRALVMVAERAALDRDIEMFVSSYCRVRNGTANRHLCCEQVTLAARGRFAVELASAAVPLLVPDLPVFLWWHDEPRLEDELFHKLDHASDRVVLDSAQFRDPHAGLQALASLLKKEREGRARFSDLNWARLTPWRGLLAGFYDVREYRAGLDHLSRVRFQYVAPEGWLGKIEPRALMLAGWLVSRLGWRIKEEQTQVRTAHAVAIRVEKDGREISLEFESVEAASTVHGWVSRVELISEGPAPSVFVVAREAEGRHLETRAVTGGETRATRMVTGGDKGEAELLSRELEILGRDLLYEEAVRASALLLEAIRTRHE